MALHEDHTYRRSTFEDSARTASETLWSLESPSAGVDSAFSRCGRGRALRSVCGVAGPGPSLLCLFDVCEIKGVGAQRILGLIPARAGSKGVPNKNTRPFAGRSLPEWAIACASAAKCLTEIAVTTDIPDLVAIAKAASVTSIHRPPAFATDEAPMIQVVAHALDEMQRRGREFDALMLLQPTSPLRSPDELDRASALLTDDADAVCSVSPLPLHFCPHYVMRLSPGGHLQHFLPEGAAVLRRQDVEPAYVRDGHVFLTRVSVLEKQRSFYGDRCVAMVRAAEELTNIDTEDDWRRAEVEFLRRRSASQTEWRDTA